MNSGIRRIFGFWALALALVLPGLPEASCTNNSLTFSPAAFPSATLYQQYEATLNIAGEKTPVGYIGVSDGALPDGLKISYEPGSDSASISGTPTLLGTYSFTINAWCMGTNSRGQNTNKKYVIEVTR
jgi:hypothetical protein